MYLARGGAGQRRQQTDPEKELLAEALAHVLPQYAAMLDEIDALKCEQEGAGALGEKNRASWRRIENCPHCIAARELDRWFAEALRSYCRQREANDQPVCCAR